MRPGIAGRAICGGDRKLAVAMATGRRSLVLAAVAIVMNLEGSHGRRFAVEQAVAADDPAAGTLV